MNEKKQSNLKLYIIIGIITSSLGGGMAYSELVTNQTLTNQIQSIQNQINSLLENPPKSESLPGSTGKTGASGADGIDGQDGADGENGTNGMDGMDGQDGINGVNGTNGETGKEGPKGKKGSRGFPGENANESLDEIKQQILDNTNAIITSTLRIDLIEDCLNLGSVSILNGTEIFFECVQD